MAAAINGIPIASVAKAPLPAGAFRAIASIFVIPQFGPMTTLTDPAGSPVETLMDIGPRHICITLFASRKLGRPGLLLPANKEVVILTSSRAERAGIP